MRQVWLQSQVCMHVDVSIQDCNVHVYYNYTSYSYGGLVTAVFSGLQDIFMNSLRLTPQCVASLLPTLSQCKMQE